MGNLKKIFLIALGIAITVFAQSESKSVEDIAF